MKQNITRKIVPCAACGEKFLDYDGTGYCETCTPPGDIRTSRYDDVEAHPFQPRKIRRSYDDQ